MSAIPSTKGLGTHTMAVQYARRKAGHACRTPDAERRECMRVQHAANAPSHANVDGFSVGGKLFDGL